MIDRRFKGIMGIWILGLILLVIPFGVYADCEPAPTSTAEEEEDQTVTVPVDYNVKAEQSVEEDRPTTYEVEGVEYTAGEGGVRLSLPIEAKKVVFIARNLLVSDEDSELEPEPRWCDLHMTITRKDSQDSADCTLTISRAPLPVISMTGRAGIHIEYGWYECAAVSEAPIWPLRLVDFVPGEAALEDAENKGEEDEGGEDDGTENDGTKQELSYVEDPAEPPEEEKADTQGAPSMEKKEISKDVPVKNNKPFPLIAEKQEVQKGKGSQSAAGSTREGAESQEKKPKADNEPVVDPATPQSTTGSTADSLRQRGEASASEKKEGSTAGTGLIKRKLVTTISKPMNHVKIAEQVTSGRTKIRKDSIRVKYNGKDVTDNCIIRMTKDGFTVDTQMNTNEGDSFVTTYSATPESDEPIDTVATTYAEEPVNHTASTTEPTDTESLTEEEAAGEGKFHPEGKTRWTRGILATGLILIALILGLLWCLRHAPDHPWTVRFTAFLKKYRGWLTEW